MSRKPDLPADLLSIAVFAPLVIATRLQRLALEAFAPSARGRREIGRMMLEKPMTFMTAALAAQASMLRIGFDLWRPFSDAHLAAAVAPVRRKVRANARRLVRR